MPTTAYHDIRFQYDPKRRQVWRAIARYLQHWVYRAEPLLELGAGYGEFSHEIHAANKWALDMNPALQQYWDPSVEAIFQSAMDPWPIPANLGTIFASNFFEHFTLEQGAEILTQARQKLRLGGRLICVQPNFRLEPHRYFDDYTHRQPYTDIGFCDFLRANGWSIIHCEPRFLPFTMKSHMPSAEWMVSFYLALPYRPLAGQFLVVAEAT